MRGKTSGVHSNQSVLRAVNEQTRKKQRKRERDRSGGDGKTTNERLRRQTGNDDHDHNSQEQSKQEKSLPSSKRILSTGLELTHLLVGGGWRKEGKHDTETTLGAPESIQEHTRRYALSTLSTVDLCASVHT